MGSANLLLTVRQKCICRPVMVPSNDMNLKVPVNNTIRFLCLSSSSSTITMYSKVNACSSIGLGYVQLYYFLLGHLSFLLLNLVLFILIIIEHKCMHIGENANTLWLAGTTHKKLFMNRTSQTLAVT